MFRFEGSTGQQPVHRPLLMAPKETSASDRWITLKKILAGVNMQMLLGLQSVALCC